MILAEGNMTEVENALSVLVVDDDNHLLRTISDLLRLRGYQARTAMSGREGLELAGQATPVVALIDLRLPDMDGLELITNLKAASEHTEVVILTGNASVESAVSAMRNQSFDYLVKPVRIDDLIATIERASERFQRKRAEAAQRESEEQLRRIFDAVSEGLLITDESGRILQANPAMTRIAARPLDDLVGESLSDLLRNAHLSEPHADPGLLDPAVLLRPDGSEREIELDVTRFAPDRRVHIIRDVTERRLLEEQLRIAQKMEALGRLAGGVAHDFNNVLTAISGYADLLRDRVADAEMRAEVDEIRGAADRASALTRQLLAFSRRQVLQPRILDVGAVIRGMEGMLRRLIREDLHLTLSCKSPIASVRADAVQIEQILLNLVVNARDAMPYGGEIRIECERLRLDTGAAATLHEAAKPRDYARIAVVDQGHGIPPEVLPHIFEPLFTTKEVGHGTGIGLATVKAQVQQVGGFITVDTSTAGTRITIYLPHEAGSDLASAPIPAPAPAPATAGGSGHILLAEDDDAIRRMVVRLLRTRGYTVTEAANGTEALKHAEQQNFDLLLTDLVLPGIGGLELARKITALQPDIRIVYTSGYAEDEVGGAVVAPGISFLAKPFMPAELLEKLSASLSTKRQA